MRTPQSIAAITPLSSTRLDRRQELEPHTTAATTQPQNPLQHHLPSRRLPNALKLHMSKHLIEEEKPVNAIKQCRNDKFKTNHRFSFFRISYSAMGECTTTRGPCHQALGDHIMRSAVGNKANVKGLNFTDLGAFLAGIAKDNELENFVTRGLGLTSR